MGGRELDLRGEVCPYTFLEVKLALEAMAAGDAVRVLLDDEVSARDVPRSLAAAGHEVVAVARLDAGTWSVSVRKGASVPA